MTRQIHSGGRHSMSSAPARYGKLRGLCAAVVLLVGNCLAAPPGAQAQAIPELFSYAELSALYERDKLPALLEGKLNRLLTMPFVNNSYAQAEPVRLACAPRLGEFLRVAFWNIERGLEREAVEAALGDATRFEALLNPEKYPPGSAARREALEEAASLRGADVIVLNEVDLGMKRTGYRHIAADLAARLGMNYAFGVQFIELSPVALSRESPGADREENEILSLVKVDPARYKGLHGLAILSRFPLENVRLVPFERQPYDWYGREKRGPGMLERGKRQIAHRVFLEKTLREVRRGGRTMLVADIADARFPHGRVSIVATHLENRTAPAGRVRQLEELLDQIKNISHPVVLAGDMNTSTEDATPTSVRREITKRVGSRNFWLKQGISYALGFGFIRDIAIGGISRARRHSDPTVRHLPFIAPNPGSRFFTTLKDFRFADGGAFDFRGDPERSTGGSRETFGNSNERDGKGFVTTYQANLSVKFVGDYKLDWIFVKPGALRHPHDEGQPYRFAPHFGRTLKAVNGIVEDRVSDHRPMLVDLPLVEPPTGQTAAPDACGQRAFSRP
ncbi:MAG TPA: endonuclease/exonuclease/phosphatase family protein [Pyrinomonadaceae bacterium]